MAINTENLQAKVKELTSQAQSISTPEEAKAFAFQALDAIRDAKESVVTEAAKIETTELLTFMLPFIPTKYQFLAKSLLSVLGLFGGGWGFGELIDQPDEIAVTIPAETQAKLDEQAAKLEAASKAADESAAKQKADFDAFVATLDAKTDEIKAATQQRFIMRGYDKNDRVIEELQFGREPPR